MKTIEEIRNWIRLHPTLAIGGALVVGALTPFPTGRKLMKLTLMSVGGDWIKDLDYK